MILVPGIEVRERESSAITAPRDKQQEPCVKKPAKFFVNRLTSSFFIGFVRVSRVCFPPCPPPFFFFAGVRAAAHGTLGTILFSVWWCREHSIARSNRGPIVGGCISYFTFLATEMVGLPVAQVSRRCVSVEVAVSCMWDITPTAFVFRRVLVRVAARRANKDLFFFLVSWLLVFVNLRRCWSYAPIVFTRASAQHFSKNKKVTIRVFSFSRITSIYVIVTLNYLCHPLCYAVGQERVHSSHQICGSTSRMSPKVFNSCGVGNTYMEICSPFAVHENLVDVCKSNPSSYI